MSRAVPYPFMVPIHSAAPPVLPCPVYTTSTKANTSFAAMWQQVSSELDYFLSSPDRGPSFIVHYSNMYATISNYITALPMSVSMLYAFIRRYLKAHVALLYEAASGLEGLELLKFYALQFERYERASHLIHNIVSPHCKGLDREILFDTAFRDEDGSYTSLSLQLGGERACEDIFLLALGQWAEQLLTPLNANCNNALSNALVENQIALYSDPTNTHRLRLSKTILSSLIKLGSWHALQAERGMHHGIGDLMLSTSVADQDEEYFFHSVELLFSSFNQHVESTLPHSLPFASPPPPPPSPFSSASASSPYPYPFFAYPSQNQASPWRNPTKWREVVDPTLYQQHFLAPFLTTFERGFDLQMLGMWSAARSGTLDELSASVGEANWTLSALTGPAPTAYISVAHISCNVQLDFLDEVACGLMEEMCVGQYGRMVDYLWKGLFRLERLAGTRARASRSLEGVLGNLDLDSERLRWCAFFDRCALGRCEALNRIYAFVGRAVSDRDPHATSKRFSSPRDKFGAHVRRVARADVAGLVAVRQNSGPGVLGAGDLKIYLDVLLGVYRRFGPRLERMVELDVVFKPALDDAFGDVVNENEFLRTWSTTPSEILLKRLNGLLKQAPLAGLGAELDDLMIIFRYLGDKDVFMKMYAQSLAKRLLCDASVSQEVEGAVVSRLAEICGEEYTGHLRRLLNEISISKDLTQDFQRTSCHRSATSNSITFDGKVVGANFWPLKVHTHPFIVPHAIAPLYEAFNRYFASRFTGRKLRWLWSHSTNEMQTNFTDRGGGKGKHTLVVSSYQAAVLVLFNVRDELWVEEVVKATGIPRDVVEQAAAPLVKAKLLSLGPRGEYCFNPGFSSKKMRLNLDNSVKYAPMSNPRTQAFKAVEGERKYATQAAVVRVLKATQKLSTRRIFERIVEGLGQKFPIRMQDVNMAIDALIEKEYIERVEGSAHEFVYIA